MPLAQRVGRVAGSLQHLPQRRRVLRDRRAACSGTRRRGSCRSSSSPPRGGCDTSAAKPASASTAASRGSSSSAGQPPPVRRGCAFRSTTRNSRSWRIPCRRTARSRRWAASARGARAAAPTTVPTPPRSPNSPLESFASSHRRSPTQPPTRAKGNGVNCRPDTTRAAGHRTRPPRRRLSYAPPTTTNGTEAAHGSLRFSRRRLLRLLRTIHRRKTPPAGPRA